MSGEIVETEPSQELVVSGGAPVTLFRTDDPVEIVGKATAVANALADVLKTKKLTTKIGAKDYVQVEGWTLCGSMLGVFPVVEWTRPIEGGWEARVEARTRDGAVVGAAEAECLRDEKRWKTADDYSIRSMAQTRAISKALRAPLGFIVALAGYETTPEEEMVGERPVEQPRREFDPEKDLLPGAISGKDAPRLLNEALVGLDPSVDWGAVVNDAIAFQYPDAKAQSVKDLPANQFQDFWRRLSNSVQWINNNTEGGDFPPVSEETLKKGFAYAFGGFNLTVTYKGEIEAEEEGVKDKAPLSPEQAQKVDEALAADDDDVEF